MALGALPYPCKMLEQRLLSPKICRRWWWSCGTFLGKTPILLGFSIPKLLIGEGASSGGDQGGLTIGGRGQGLGRAPSWCGQPLAPLWLSFGLQSSSGKPGRAYGVGSLWPPSGSRSVFSPLPEKIGVLELVSSNSENISYVAFLKHKNSRKQGTGTVVSCQ
jgi:hypothetical protein